MKTVLQTLNLFPGYLFPLTASSTVVSTSSKLQLSQDAAATAAAAAGGEQLHVARLRHELREEHDKVQRLSAQLSTNVSLRHIKNPLYLTGLPV